MFNFDLTGTIAAGHFPSYNSSMGISATLMNGSKERGSASNKVLIVSVIIYFCVQISPLQPHYANIFQLFVHIWVQKEVGYH
jgi:hypothetical protein